MDANDQGRDPHESPPTLQAGKWLEWIDKTGPRWWKWMRKLLLATEAGLVLTKHEAPAVVARAVVVLGDVIFSKPSRG